MNTNSPTVTATFTAIFGGLGSVFASRIKQITFPIKQNSSTGKTNNKEK